MTRVLLIRHADNESVGRFVAGRKPGVHMNQAGEAQAEQLAERLAGLPITAIYSSPMERAGETARPLARRLGLEIYVAERLNELDYGEWTGLGPQELAGIPLWHEFNLHRSRTRIPGGETLLEAQARAVAAIEQLASQHPDQTVAVVSHGDIIRGLIAYYTGVPLDLSLRLEISMASVSVLALSAGEVRLLMLNHTGDLASLWAS